MHGRLMVMALIIALGLIPLASAGVRATFFYNGTVLFYFPSRGWVEFPENFTLITPVSDVMRTGQLIAPTNFPGTLTFVTQSRGVVELQEPNVTETYVLLPLNSRITYLNPTPTSVKEENGYLNLTFATGNVTVLYYVVPDQGSLVLNPYVYTTLISSSISAYMAYRLWRRRPTPQMTPPDQLDDRDVKILNAIKSGADSLSKISELSLLPRTTVYRRVKRLVNMGIVQEIRERGKVKYVVRDNEK
jgi:Sugar-specific transcriptional regulator TrmB.